MAYDNDVFCVLKIRTDATTTKKKNESKIARTEPSLPPDSTRFFGNQRRSIKWKKQCGRYVDKEVYLGSVECKDTRLRLHVLRLFCVMSSSWPHARRRQDDHVPSRELGAREIERIERQSRGRNDRKTGTTGPAPCLDLNPRRAAGSGRYRLRRPGTRSIRHRISWRGMGWPYPSARPFCPGTSSDGCCSGWSDGTLGGNGRPSAMAHHCCMYQRFPFRHRRLSIRTRGRGGGRDRDHPP